MAVLLARANDALNVNPPAGDSFLTTNGSNWLWAVTAIYVVSFLALYGLTYVARGGEKIFHYLFGIALLVGSITYFSSASDLGFSVVRQVNSIDYDDFTRQMFFTRQIFFTKYINWVVSFPVVIIALGLLSNVSWATIVYNVFLSWIWIVSYLVGAYTTSNYKWGFYAFGTVAWLLLAFSTFRGGATGAKRVGVGRDHGILAGWVNLLWLLYPIAWGVSDGGNRIGVVGSWIFFGILDILLIPITAFVFLFLSRRWDYGGLNIAFTQYGRAPVAGGHYPEKGAATSAAPGVTTASSAV